MRNLFFVILGICILLVGCSQKMREVRVAGQQKGRMKVSSEQRLSLSDGSSYRVVVLQDTETSQNYLIVPHIGISQMKAE